MSGRIERRTNALAVLDVGHGNCAVLTSQSGTVVIDAGPGSTLLQYLEEINACTLDLVLISHADEDHIAGLLALLSSAIIQIREVRLNSDAMKGSKIWDDLLFELAFQEKEGAIALKVSLTRTNQESLRFGKSRIEILAPDKYLAAKGPGAEHRGGGRITHNTISAVVRICYDDQPIVLLPGDIDGIGVRELLLSGVDTEAPVLVFPHHGGLIEGDDDLHNIAELLQKIRPRVILFSIGRRGRGTTKPSPEIITKISELGLEARIACTQLSPHCSNVLPQQPPEHLLPVAAKGREKNRCCAGTLLLPLNAPGTVLPEAAPHQSFIDEAASTALCSRETI